jgi:hypothetical protein
MNNKITPEYVLNMLQELKKVTGDTTFSASEFSKKYPTFSIFRIFLFSKGIIKKHYGINKWISIEPNIIMAKELLKLYTNYSKENAIRSKNRKLEKNNIKIDEKIEVLETLENKIKSNQSFRKYRRPTKKASNKNTAMSLAKEIRQEGELWLDAVSRASVIMKGGATKKPQLRDLTMQELYPRAYAQDLKKHGYNDVFEVVTENSQLKNDFEIINIKYLQLQEMLKESREGLIRQETANQSLKQRLKEAEKGIDENVKKLIERISDLKEKIEAQNEEISDLQDRLIDDKKKSNAPASKTYKLFGIPVFSINNK